MRHNAPEERSISRREWLWVASVSCVILLAAVMPNIWGYVSTPADMHFGGLAYNWQDGNSYLAKMAEGARGDWLYTVPFTSDPGEGVWLYPHYLLLGHLSERLGIENVHVFNTARLISGAILLFTLYYFAARFFAEQAERRFAFLVTALSAGFGWIVILFGQLYSDLLKAEIFPFLAIMANPHFPISMAALIWLVDLAVPHCDNAAKRRLDPTEWARVISGTVILALMQPYGLVIAVVVTSAWAATDWLLRRKPTWRTTCVLASMLIIGLPYIAYTVWVTHTQPALMGWDLQNMTISPPIWELIISLGLVLLFALPAMVQAVRRRSHDDFLLLYWLAAALVIMYLPYQQQRRFSLALAVPVGIFAVRGLRGLVHGVPIGRFAFVVVTNLSNVMVFLLIFSALPKFPSYLYFTQSEWNGMAYLHANAEKHSLVLASPDLGLYIPAWAGQRVLYGHPHETANARARSNDAQSFFEGKPTGNLPYTDALGQQVDYIFEGPRERLIGSPAVPADFAPVFTDGDTTIYRHK